MPALLEYNDSEVSHSHKLTSGQQFNLKQFFWIWYYEHQDDVILRIFIFKTIKVKHLKFLFELLFGKE